MKKILLVDGNSLLHRAYHAYPPLTTKEGELVGAVYGFSVLLLTTIEKLSPTHMAVAWDIGKETFRHGIYAEYKAGRPEMDVDLFNQIERTKEVVSVLNIPQYGLAGFEADDLIGTLSLKASKEKDAQIVIVTGDRDALQLIKDKKIVVYIPVNGGWGKSGVDRGTAIYDEEAVVAKYHLRPDQMIELKALMGDASDNIKGVKGIGQVTATKLLEQFDSVEELYENLERLKTTERIKKLLTDDMVSAFLSKKLATIDRNVEIEFDWQKCKLADYDRDGAVELFQKLEFRSLLSRLPSDKWEEDLGEVFA